MRAKYVFLALMTVLLTYCELQTTEARIFGRRRAAAVNNCPGGVCPSPTYTGSRNGLTVNNKGGFEGQLPDSYYDSYLQQTATVAVADDTPPPPPAEYSIVTKRSVTTAQEPTLADAVAKLDALRTQLEEAEQLVADAAAAERKRAAIEAARMDAEIRVMQIEHQAEIEALKAKHKALQIKSGTFGSDNDPGPVQ